MLDNEVELNGKILRRHPEFTCYGATRCGEVYRLDRGNKLTGSFNKIAGYYYIRVCQNNKPRTLRLHIFIAKCWIPNPNNHRVVNHIDGNKTHCHVDNLEWCTDSMNQQHAIRLGLKQKGEELYNASLANEDVHAICRFLEQGYRLKDLADKFDVKKDNIRKIRDGSCYFHIRKLYVNIPHKYKTEHSVGTVQWVCNKVVEGLSDKVISEACTSKLTPIDVKRIRHKIRYKDISDKYFD